MLIFKWYFHIFTLQLLRFTHELSSAFNSELKAYELATELSRLAARPSVIGNANEIATRYDNGKKDAESIVAFNWVSSPSTLAASSWQRAVAACSNCCSCCCCCCSVKVTQHFKWMKWKQILQIYSLQRTQAQAHGRLLLLLHLLLPLAVARSTAVTFWARRTRYLCACICNAFMHSFHSFHLVVDLLTGLRRPKLRPQAK